MKTLKLFSVIAISSLLFAGCRGSEGPVGPQGPAGYDGTNANVVGETFSVNSWNWQAPDYYATFNVPDLTSSVQDYGAVSVFISIDGGGTWNAIPTTSVGASENAFWSYATQVGLAQVNFEWNSEGADGDPNSTFAAQVGVKVVCIDATAIKQHPNINWHNYSQVQAILLQEQSAKTN